MIYHTPVLYHEVLEHLVHTPNGIYIDCTMGEGGHTAGILEAISHKGRVISLDQDIQMINKARHRFSSENRFTCLHTNFRDIKNALESIGVYRVDGILADLGLSMFHYKASDKGFSFAKDDPLDMSFNSSLLNAADIMNDFSSEQIQEILWTYGEEPHAKRIADFIIYYRSHVQPIKTTKQLADIIYKALTSIKGYKMGKIHPATQTFQALRIVVNQELDSLHILLKESLNLLNHNGSMVFLTYHSLEDRIVKEFIQNHKEQFIDFNKKPIIPKKEEIEHNKASRSAKLRFFKRLYVTQEDFSL